MSEAMFYLTLETGKFPIDAFVTFEITAQGVELVELADWSPGEAVDFEPAFRWARSCTLEGCDAPPEGWRIQTLDEHGNTRRYCDA